MLKAKFLLSGLLVLMLLGCNTRTEVRTLFVAASYTTECPHMAYIGPKPERCIQARFDANQPWYGFSQPIEGFVYQEGFQYQLELRVQHDTSGMMDVPPKFSLIRVISKVPAS